MIRSPIALTGAAQRLHRLATALQALWLGRPGLVAKILAIVAFFSIGVV